MSIQLGSSWEALAGKEEPGGKEEQRTGGDGRRGVSKRLALRRSPPFKNSRRGWDSLFCKKVKVEVSLFTFHFQFLLCKLLYPQSAFAAHRIETAEVALENEMHIN